MFRPVTWLVLAALLWMGGLVWATSPAPRQLGRPASFVTTTVYALGAVICHQRPARSFTIWHTQMPVCARCTGVYAGAALAGLVLLVAPPRRALSPFQARRLLGASALPVLMTLGYEWTSGETPANLLRAFSGVPLGAAVLWVIAALMSSPPASAIQSSYTSVP